MKRSFIAMAAPIAGLLSLALLPCSEVRGNEAVNRAPLQAQPYGRLPLGSVHAKNWLKHQLELQRDGLTGHAEQLYTDIGESDWLTGGNRGGKHAGERGPYYAKGLIALAYALDDQGLKDKAQRWVDQILKSQRENGDFGPEKLSWWPNMIVIHFMRDYYEATGDKRVPDFLQRYFRFQLETLPSHSLVSHSRWAKARGGDNLEIVLWLYNRTGEPWLLELATLIIRQTNEWHKYYANGTGDNIYPQHIVNLMQGLKTPPLMYLVTGDPEHRAGFTNAMKPEGWLMERCGRIDGMFSGTEPITDRSSTEGTELCAIVEGILSSTVAIKVLGDAAIGDRLEVIAYNALPADLTPDITGMRYYILPNQPKCTNERLGFTFQGQNTKAICPSFYSGFGCCPSNFHYGWPKFVHNMWMATHDHGLAAATYGPNTVTATVGSKGQEVTIDQATDYPFRTESTLTITTAQPVAFPLELRIPGWCAKPTVRVNGKQREGVEPGTFHRIEREWKSGDVVQLQFPMTPTTSRWINDSVSITRGPLVFSLLIEEDWKIIESVLDGRFHTHEIRPASAWNYALILNDQGQPAIETIVSDSMPAQPFKAAEAPVRLKVKAARTTEGGWGTFRDDFPARAVEPPAGPVTVSEEPEDVVLVPYGSTEIRITHFPWAKK